MRGHAPEWWVSDVEYEKAWHLELAEKCRFLHCSGMLGSESVGWSPKKDCQQHTRGILIQRPCGPQMEATL